MENILKFQSQIYEINKSKGFWPENVKDRSQGEAVALICSELYEAVEAHRKGKFASQFIKEEWNELPGGNYDYLTNGDTKAFTLAFKTCIKDTVEDEIADAVIRILDCCYGWEWDLTFGKEFGHPSTGNFAHDILHINDFVIKSFYESVFPTGDGNNTWYYTMRAILALCEWYNINLEQHITWKLKFNSSRPFMHGKAY